MSRRATRVEHPDDDEEEDAVVGRRGYPLAGVRELRLRGSGRQSVGASVDVTAEPAALVLRVRRPCDAHDAHGVVEQVGTGVGVTEAVITVAGGSPIARWVVDGATTAAMKAGDALIVTVTDVGAGGRQERAGAGAVRGGVGGGWDLGWRKGRKRSAGAREEEETAMERGASTLLRGMQERAFVLSFLDAKDIDAAHAAIRRAGGCSPAPAEHEGGKRRAGTQKERRVAATALPEDEPQVNAFDAKIEAGSAADYFRYYAMIPQQQNMLQDRVRTGTYFTAIMENAGDFRGKVVLDVGAGSGILSFFAAMAGARRVYAVEASRMTEHCQRLIDGNPHLKDVVVVVPGKVEEVNIPEPVDVLISEPMGTMLYNERMIESYLIARDRFMRRNRAGASNISVGRMFPGAGRVHCSPFGDETLWSEIRDKAHFWLADDFYGIDLTPLREEALKAYYRQCTVDAFDPELLLARPASFTWDWMALKAKDLEALEFPLKFTCEKSGTMHGFAAWFDVLFEGSGSRRWLSTAPGLPTTHWFQMRFVFQRPMTVVAGQVVSGVMRMVAGDNQSYMVSIDVVSNVVSGEQARSGEWDLKDPYYRQCVHPQPGYTQEQTAQWYGVPPGDQVGWSQWQQWE